MKYLVGHPETLEALRRLSLEGGESTTTTMEMARMRYAQALVGRFQILESPACPKIDPKIQIDPQFKWCSDEFRSRMNSWLAERFGGDPVVFVWDPAPMRDKTVRG